MANVVVVGSQWGDEGKGKIVDWLSERADVVVRFQGGHNAGHTLVIDGKVYKLSLLPSGVVREGKLSIIGNGVVFDPHAFVAEVAKLKAQGVEVTPDRLKIAENAALILSLHRELDGFREDAASNSGTKIGTTRRGIGPAYEDKVGRRAIRVMDLAEPGNPAAEDRPAADAPQCAAPRAWPRRGRRMTRSIDELTSVADEILPYMDRVWKMLDDAAPRRRRASCSRARKARCSTSTTAPIRSSPRRTPWPARRRPAPASAPARSAMCSASPRPIRRASAKGRSRPSRTTRSASSSARAATNSASSPGRKRRCGWFDAVLVRQAVAVNGIKGIALTKLDVLDGLDEIKVCTGYRLDGEVIDYLPASQGAQARVEPVYETLEGWKGTTAGARSWNDLPAQAVKYVRYIEELIGAPVALLSTSPERDDTILVTDPFQD